MMTAKKIEFVETDDWMELLLDGKRVFGNHSIDVKEMLELLGVTYSEIWVEGEDAWDEWDSTHRDFDERHPNFVKEPK